MIDSAQKHESPSSQNKHQEEHLLIVSPASPPYHLNEKDGINVVPETHESNNTEQVPMPSLARRRSSTLTSSRKTCPWWLFFIFGTLTIAVTAGGVYYYFLHKTTSSRLQRESVAPSTETTQPSCSPGWFRANGRCIKCPKDTEWNGSYCRVQNSEKKQSQASITSGINGTNIGAADEHAKRFRPEELRAFIGGLRTHDSHFPSDSSARARQDQEMA